MRKLSGLILAGLLAMTLASCAGYVSEVDMRPGEIQLADMIGPGGCFMIDRSYHPVAPCCTVSKIEWRQGHMVMCACPEEAERELVEFRQVRIVKADGADMLHPDGRPMK